MRVSGVRVGIGALALAAMSLAGPACAASKGHTSKAARPDTVPKAQASHAKAQPSFEAIMAMLDKLFPPQPDPDPARLALARASVTAMWPEGSYAKLMTGFMGGMFTRAMELKQSDFAALGGAPAKIGATAGQADPSIHDAAVAKDPYFDQRMAAVRDAVGEELGKVSTIIDPRIREGLARSMARRFDQKQLADINAFFATPSGHALASQSLQMWVDPDMMRSLFASVPEMMKLMPEMTEKIKAAEQKYPEPQAPSKEPSKPESH